MTKIENIEITRKVTTEEKTVLDMSHMKFAVVDEDSVVNVMFVSGMSAHDWIDRQGYSHYRVVDIRTGNELAPPGKTSEKVSKEPWKPFEITFWELVKFLPCKEDLNKWANLRSVNPRVNSRGNKVINAKEAKDLGATYEELLWITEKVAENNPDVKARLKAHRSWIGEYPLKISEDKMSGLVYNLMNEVY